MCWESVEVVEFALEAHRRDHLGPLGEGAGELRQRFRERLRAQERGFEQRGDPAQVAVEGDQHRLEVIETADDQPAQRVLGQRRLSWLPNNLRSSPSSITSCSGPS